LLLIDPPFERGDEYAQVLDTLAALKGRRAACALVWLPLKDLRPSTPSCAGWTPWTYPMSQWRKSGCAA
jgi:23S rRNA A2030 N6-methylase RlmJ